MPVDPTMVHMAYKEEEEKAKVAIKKLDAILMDAGVMCFLELMLHAYQCITNLISIHIFNMHEAVS